MAAQTHLIDLDIDPDEDAEWSLQKNVTNYFGWIDRRGNKEQVFEWACCHRVSAKASHENPRN